MQNIMSEVSLAVCLIFIAVKSCSCCSVLYWILNCVFCNISLKSCDKDVKHLKPSKNEVSFLFFSCFRIAIALLYENIQKCGSVSNYLNHVITVITKRDLKKTLFLTLTQLSSPKLSPRELHLLFGFRESFQIDLGWCGVWELC